MIYLVYHLRLFIQVNPGLQVPFGPFSLTCSENNLWDLGNLGFYRLYADSLPPAFHILSATQPSLLKQWWEHKALILNSSLASSFLWPSMDFCHLSNTVPVQYYSYSQTGHGQVASSVRPSGTHYLNTFHYPQSLACSCRWCTMLEGRQLQRLATEREWSPCSEASCLTETRNQLRHRLQLRYVLSCWCAPC